MLVCKIVDDKTEPQTIPVEADRLGDWFWGYRRESWRDDYKYQKMTM